MSRNFYPTALLAALSFAVAMPLHAQQKLADGLVTSTQAQLHRISNSPAKDRIRSAYASQGSRLETWQSPRKAASDTVFTVPYFEDFNTQEDFNRWTVINVANDYSTWQWNRYQQNARYMFNSSLDADDWLISPNIALEAGKSYNLQFKVKDILWDEHELLSVHLGTSTDTATMTTLIPTFEFNNNRIFEIHGTEFQVPASGNYHLGFHAESPKTAFSIDLDSIQITGGADLASTPDSVTDFTVTPDQNGAYTAAIHFVAPTTTGNGQPLTELTKIDVLRGDSVIHTFAPAAVGQSYDFTDQLDTLGMKYYYVTAYNSAGAGVTLNRSVYVGLDVPQMPKNFSIRDNGDGTVDMSWDAVTKGKHGGAIGPDALHYNIYVPGSNRYKDDKVATTQNTNGRITGLDVEGMQSDYYLGLTAENAAGESEEGTSVGFLTGKGYDIPFQESFPGGTLEHDYWATAGDGVDSTWHITNSMSSSLEQTDNGSAYVLLTQSTGNSILASGKISTHGATAARLLFDWIGETDAPAKLDIYAARGTEGDSLIGTVNIPANTPGSWANQQFEIGGVAKYPYTRIYFVASTTGSQTAILVDRIRVFNVLPYDLSASIDPPYKARIDELAKVNVSVSNYSDTPSGDYSVQFYVNGKLHSTRTGTAIPAFSDSTLTFSYTPKATDGDSLEVYAKVVYDQDLDEDNNTSDIKTIKLQPSDFPKPVDVTAHRNSGNGVDVSWSAPDQSHRVLTEDFEDYAPWTTTDFGGWTNIDEDGDVSYGMAGVTVPTTLKAFGYMIFNPTAATPSINTKIYTYYAPHSGQQYAIAMATNPESSDGSSDWLISPELSGNEQTIEFWAKSLVDVYDLEQFEVLYTSDETKTNWYQLADHPSVAPAEWTLFEQTLPAGTKYFAIHYVGTGFVFQLDDITYEAAPKTINGYKVYRDGQFISDVSGDVTTYTDNDAPDGQHFYNVVSVFDDGESTMSDPALITTADGITNVVSGDESAVKNAPRYNLAGQRVGESYHGVVIQNGKKLIQK